MREKYIRGGNVRVANVISVKVLTLIIHHIRI